jgi:hypothetical protein
VRRRQATPVDNLEAFEEERTRTRSSRNCDWPCVMEAACRTLATQRLKRSGMHWRHAGGHAILTLRSSWRRATASTGLGR